MHNVCVYASFMQVLYDGKQVSWQVILRAIQDMGYTGRHLATSK